MCDEQSSEGVRSRQKETKRDAPVGWLLLPSHEGTGAGVPMGEASATGSEIRESQTERDFSLHSLKPSVRGRGSNCETCASGFLRVMSKSS